MVIDSACPRPDMYMLADGVYFCTSDIIWLEKQKASFIVKYWVLLWLCDYLSHGNSKNGVVVNNFVGGLNEVSLSICWKQAIMQTQ